jgi:hypothetical protein
MADSLLNIALALVVALATPFPNGLHCDHSPYALGDILPDDGTKPGSWVISIEKVTADGKIVGYLYGMKSGARLLQPTYAMPQSLLVELKQTPLSVRNVTRALPMQLHVSSCRDDEMTQRPR